MPRKMRYPDTRDRSGRGNRNPLTLNLAKPPSPRQLDELYVANHREVPEPQLADGVIALPSERELRALQEGEPEPRRQGKLTAKERLAEWDRRQKPERRAYMRAYGKARYARSKAQLHAALSVFRAQLPAQLPEALEARLQLYREAFPAALDAYRHPERHPAPPKPQGEPPQLRAARIKRERLDRERRKREANYFSK